MVRLDMKKKLVARSDRVKCCDFHPTEPWLLCSLFSGQVHIWNYSTQTLVKTFEVSDTPVRAAKFIARKQWIVTASDDMCLRVFNYNTMQRVKTIEAHNDYIRSIAVHPTQSYILTSSDDMSIKLWDWDKNWTSVLFEGHTHYVMQVVFNPKDPNMFASASLDRTVKVWGLNSNAPYFTLEGHDKGVNCVDYLADGDKPYLVSGSDDFTAKVWDYQSKTCVATLTGHSGNVSAVRFHPELPLIVTASEDGTVRLWNSGTYRSEKIMNQAMDRAWTIAAIPGSNMLAVGYDEGAVVVKFGKDEPAYSMDSAGKIIWAKRSEILIAAPQKGAEEPKDGEKVMLPTKELGRTDFPARCLKHDPTGRFVAAVGDGEYVIYTALAWRNKSFGNGLDFVWGDQSGYYAVRETGGKVTLFKNFKETASVRVGGSFVPEGLFGGALIGIKGPETLVFFDWEGRLVRQIEVAPKHVFWADNGERVAIATDTSFFVLKYNAAAVSEAYSAGAAAVGEEGIDAAFEVENEISDKVRSAVWVGDCFIYMNASSNKLCYCVGGQVFTVALLDKPMYVLGYIPRDSRVYLMDKAFNIVSFKLQLSVINYQTAILRGDSFAAAQLLEQVPTDQRTRVAKFLQAQGLIEEALNVSTDDDHRFELALQLGRLDVGLDIANLSGPGQNHRWKLLSDAALRACQFDLAVQCMEHCDDTAGLLLVHSSLGNSEKLLELAERARKQGRANIAFVCYFVTRHVKECLDLLCETSRFAEAAFMARTYMPSEVTRIVQLWRADLSKKVSSKAAEALADPMDYPNLFPDIQDALEVEKVLMKEYTETHSSCEYENFKDFLNRNPIEEYRKAQSSSTRDSVAEGEDKPKEDDATVEEKKEDQPEAETAETSTEAN